MILLGSLPLYRVILLNIEFSQFSDLAGVTVPVGAMAAMDIVLGKFIYLFFLDFSKFQCWYLLFPFVAIHSTASSTSNCFRYGLALGALGLGVGLAAGAAAASYPYYNNYGYYNSYPYYGGGYSDPGYYNNYYGYY